MGQCDELLRNMLRNTLRTWGTWWEYIRNMGNMVGVHWELGEHGGSTLGIKQFKNPHYKRMCFLLTQQVVAHGKCEINFCGFIHYKCTICDVYYGISIN